MSDKIPLYRSSLNTARHCNEVDIWRQSDLENSRCATAIHNAIDCNFVDNHLNTDFMKSIIDEFGSKKINDNPRQYIKAVLDSHKAPRLDYLPTFSGGLVGYFGYDYIKYSEPGVKLDAKDDGNFKDVDLMPVSYTHLTLPTIA